MHIPVKVILADNSEEDQIIEEAGLKVKECNEKVWNLMCDICSKKFALNRDLPIHKQVHTGEKNFPCMFARRKINYQSEDYLIIHTQIHTDEGHISATFVGNPFQI